MSWTKSRILDTLRHCHKRGLPLAYTKMAQRKQPLVSAAAYHFGSYRAAVEKAGIDYEAESRRPHWTKQLIITAIKKARRKGVDLNWAAVCSGQPSLRRAAYASIQPRLFGSWARALHAAGIDAEMVQIYQHRDKSTIIFDLKSRAADREPLNSGAVQQDDPALHAAALRHFGTFDKALHAAKIEPGKHRQRRAWTRPQIIAELKKFARKGSMTSTALRAGDMSLYGAALREFKSFSAARAAIKK